MIEIATDPALSTDGAFIGDNLVLFDLLEASQTSWRSSDHRLKTGVTDYFHMNAIDWPCFFVFAARSRVVERPHAEDPERCARAPVETVDCEQDAPIGEREAPGLR